MPQGSLASVYAAPIELRRAAPLHLQYHVYTMVVWRSGNDVGHVHGLVLCPSRLVLGMGWVTCSGSTSGVRKLHISYQHLRRLSLVTPPLVGVISIRPASGR